MFGIKLNDTTNACKAYRVTRDTRLSSIAINAFHFNCRTSPESYSARAIVGRLFRFTWSDRRVGDSKLAIKEMGSRGFFLCLYSWLEKYFSRGDYKISE